MTTNLYSPFNNFDLSSSRVFPTINRKFNEAKLNDNAPVTLCGSGSLKCEFLHAENMTQAVIFTIENRLFEYLYNVGTDTEVSIKNLVQTLLKIIGYKRTIVWDDTKPDRTLRKLMNLSKLKSIGWEVTALPFSIQNIYTAINL